jgi:hypothetical protein
VDCCVPDPDIPESEQALYDRAKRLHPDEKFPALTDLPPSLSRFRRASA